MRDGYCIRSERSRLAVRREYRAYRTARARANAQRNSSAASSQPNPNNAFRRKKRHHDRVARNRLYRPERIRPPFAAGRSATGRRADRAHHGSAGEVRFGAGVLSRETLHDHAADLAEIGRALGRDGQLSLWSCETGQGKRGAAFVDALARATGADVAATVGLVGSAE